MSPHRWYSVDVFHRWGGTFRKRIDFDNEDAARTFCTKVSVILKSPWILWVSDDEYANLADVEAWRALDRR